MDDVNTNEASEFYTLLHFNTFNNNFPRIIYHIKFGVAAVDVAVEWLRRFKVRMQLPDANKMPQRAAKKEGITRISQAPIHRLCTN